MRKVTKYLKEWDKTVVDVTLPVPGTGAWHRVTRR